MNDTADTWVLVVVVLSLLSFVAWSVWLVHAYDRSRRESHRMRLDADDRLRREAERRRVLFDRAMSRTTGSAEGSTMSPTAECQRLLPGGQQHRREGRVL